MSTSGVTLRVIHADGKPAAGALVAVVRSSAPFPEIALAVDDRGERTLPLPEGDFTLRADATGGQTGEATVKVGAGGAPITVAIRLA